MRRLNSKGGANQSENSKLEQLLVTLQADKQKLELFSKKLTEQKNKIVAKQKRQKNLQNSLFNERESTNNLIKKVQQLVVRLKELTILNEKLDQVRIALNSEQTVSPNDWIKTPASVLSWSNKGGRISLSIVGGHNLNSKGIKI